MGAALSAAHVPEGPTLPTLVEDSQGNRVYCRLHGLKDAIVQRGKKESGLGRRRWVVERTFAWMKRYRRLATRYERRADIHLGLLLLGCALIASNFCR